MAMGPRPVVSSEQVERVARTHYGWRARATELEAEFDRNFLLEADDGRRCVLKISPEGTEEPVLRCQVETLRFLATTGLAPLIQQVVPDRDRRDLLQVSFGDGPPHWVRVYSWLEGFPLVQLSGSPSRLLSELGHTLARLDQLLLAFDHPGAHREIPWDVTRTLDLAHNLEHVPQPRRRALLARLLDRFQRRVVPRLSGMRRSVIYNDANDRNVLVSDLEPSRARISGLIDFGDMVHTITVAELAIACAYVMLDAEDPVAAAAHVASGYGAVRPLDPRERELLYDLIVARLCASALMSAGARARDPDNEYRMISSEPVWRLLEELSMIDHDDAASRLAGAVDGDHIPKRTVAEILEIRRRHLGYNLSVAYSSPLKIVRGEGQYLFDEEGRRYLDLVNNVCHVGHCHPHVVAAVQRQAAVLNTNSRYLHDNLAEYVTRLAATLPDPLEVCFLVCTGTEANDLALRLARAHTGRREVVVLDHAYHGNSPTQVEISPYKCEGPGGEGLAAHARKVPMPDPYRGLHRGPDAGARYAGHVADAVAELRATSGGMGAFIAESLISCGGQIVPPSGFLEASYRAVREAGGVCIADEVQVGFGRVGSHLWAFEIHGVVPDIVTLGKPIGNGHPLAAVVTTPSVAASFDTGMEYFNTFGANPVSCAAGLAVLEVIERERLQRHALDVGESFMAGLRELQTRHDVIGDVRGAGLFIGVELVSDRDHRVPAPREAAQVIERMKGRGILLSTDGPDHNVLKIKPPLVIEPADVETTLAGLDEVLAEIG
jgi:4-aminobutyrate aminotransferase-like enzyme/Ser/Thr protein kinase RdoA (MazF antagonist)